MIPGGLPPLQKPAAIGVSILLMLGSGMRDSLKDSNEPTMGHWLTSLYWSFAWPALVLAFGLVMKFFI
jgi:hypothetical protein